MRLPASLRFISVALSTILSTTTSLQIGEVSPSNIPSLRTSHPGDGPIISMVVISDFFRISPPKGVDAEQSNLELKPHDEDTTANYGVLDCDDEEEQKDQLTGYELECEDLKKQSAEEIKDLSPEFLLDCEEDEKDDQEEEDYAEVMPQDPQPLLICDDEEDNNEEVDQISSLSKQHEAASLDENDREEKWAEMLRLQSIEDLLETTQGATSELESDSSVGRVHEAFSICESKCAYDSSGPACGSDGHTYPNKCMITCLDPGTKYFHRGYCLQYEESSCNVECSLEKEWICGIDGQTYINYCHYAVTNCDKRMASLPFLSGKCASDKMTDI